MSPNHSENRRVIGFTSTKDLKLELRILKETERRIPKNLVIVDIVPVPIANKNQLRQDMVPDHLPKQNQKGLAMAPVPIMSKDQMRVAMAPVPIMSKNQLRKNMVPDQALHHPAPLTAIQLAPVMGQNLIILKHRKVDQVMGIAASLKLER
jgi:hypothetical protein